MFLIMFLLIMLVVHYRQEKCIHKLIDELDRVKWKKK
jgi:hypothetical protein